MAREKVATVGGLNLAETGSKGRVAVVGSGDSEGEGGDIQRLKSK